MNITRRDSIKLAGCTALGMCVGAVNAADFIQDKVPPRMPLDEFVKDSDLMKALIRGVRAMKARKSSDPLSWFFQAAIHGVTDDMIAVAATQDPGVNTRLAEH